MCDRWLVSFDSLCWLPNGILESLVWNLPTIIVWRRVASFKTRDHVIRMLSVQGQCQSIVGFVISITYVVCGLINTFDNRLFRHAPLSLDSTKVRKLNSNFNGARETVNFIPNAGQLQYEERIIDISLLDDYAAVTRTQLWMPFEA